MQVNRRLALLQRLPQKYHALHDFLEKEVLTTRNSLITTFNQGAATDVWEDLQFTHQIFSPSDFGAHNCLVRPNANIVLVDFEYSGRDDPAKLLADFLWHPGSGLSPEEQNLAIRVVSGDTEDSDRFLSRFARLYPLIGLNWVLILLNEFLPEKWAHRRIASSKSEDDWDEFSSATAHSPSLYGKGKRVYSRRGNLMITLGETGVANFFTEEQIKLTEQFLRDGYLIFPVENLIYLQNIKDFLIKQITSILTLNAGSDIDILNEFHTVVGQANINQIRLNLIDALNTRGETHKELFWLAQSKISDLVGNELAMQRRINLSIQIPKDETSVLDIHRDTDSGNSPFEVVLWLPLVDCYQTKSMFILPKHIEKESSSLLRNDKINTTDDLQQEFQSDLNYLNVPYGHSSIYTHCVSWQHNK